MSPDFDLVVVGCGLTGASTAWAATGRDASVLVLDRFASGHDRGSSHGSARIVRRAYGDPLYTDLMGRAFDLWAELEQQSGRTLLRWLGGLDWGSGRDVAAVAAGLRECGVAHEVLGAAEAERRWPGMRFEGDVVHHGQAGTVDAQGGVDAMTALAAARGAEVRHGQLVEAIEPAGDVATVRLASGDPVTARWVVVAAGAWVEPLVGGLVPLPPITVTQQQAFHFPRLDPTAPAWPSVIHVQGGHDEFYHLAGGRDGGAGDDRKVAEHYHGKPGAADDRDAVIDPESRRRVVEYVKRWLPGLEPRPRAETSCLYTKTPTEDFLIDRVGPVVVSSPCSGHGAKFAPLVGELTARRAFGDGEVPERFRLAYHRGARGGSVSF